ncbi:MAG TPA: YtxH domain-containing protein [Flavobacterium sp.]|nr:YtxH domain-containing protein [Flavobacterium sp.]
MSKGKVLLGVLAGVAVGTALGVLMAPDKGSETRKKLAKKGNDYTDGLKKTVSNLRGRYNDTIDQVSSKLETAAANGNAALHNAKDAAMDAKSELKSAARSVTQ